MRTVRRPKRIANKESIAQRGKLFRKRLVIFFFFRMEPNVLQNQDFSIDQRFALRFNTRTDAVQTKYHWLAEQLFQFSCSRMQRIFRIRSAFRPAQMRSQHQPSTLFDRQFQRRKRFADPRVVRHHTLFQRHIKIHAQKDALPAHLQIFNCQFIHFSSLGTPFSRMAGSYCNTC